MPRVQNPSLGPGQAAFLVNTVMLTAAQIRALNSVPVQIVPAPGAGKLILPMYIAVINNYGTHPFLVPAGGTDQLNVTYSPSGDFITEIFPPAVAGVGSLFASQTCAPGGDYILPGDDNSAIQIAGVSPYTNGAIATATLGAGGTGYVANDTGTITTGSANATYKVLTVGAGGAVLTFQITGAGTDYATGNGQATATGGAQPGVGVGFTVNVTAVTPGDGTLKVITYYQVVAVP